MYYREHEFFGDTGNYLTDVKVLKMKFILEDLKHLQPKKSRNKMTYYSSSISTDSVSRGSVYSYSI